VKKNCIDRKNSSLHGGCPLDFHQIPNASSKLDIAYRSTSTGAVSTVLRRELSVLSSSLLFVTLEGFSFGRARDSCSLLNH